MAIGAVSARCPQSPRGSATLPEHKFQNPAVPGTRGRCVGQYSKVSTQTCRDGLYRSSGESIGEEEHATPWERVGLRDQQIHRESLYSTQIEGQFDTILTKFSSEAFKRFGNR